MKRGPSFLHIPTIDSDKPKSSQTSNSKTSNSAAVGVRQGRTTDFAHVTRLQEDIQKLRSQKHRKWQQTQAVRRRFYTVADLEGKSRDEEAIRGQFASNRNPGAVLGSELREIGLEALQLTNEFRAQHQRPPLKWHQALADIGYEHSQNMGDGKVPFSHTGFDERVKCYPFSYRAAAENLAMSHGLRGVAKVAVNGWIDSPGHRKNLLSDQTFCGIGVYRNVAGAYYLTQLFAKT